MVTPMTPDQLLAALRKWNVQVREYSGWRTRSRPQAWGPVHGVVVHHTGSDSQSEDYNDFLFTQGRPEEGIPAPLANVATEMDGDLWLGAWGRANHAGAGSRTILNHVINEDYDGYNRELSPPEDDGTIGNQYFYGNEVKYDGGQPMTSAQNRTAVKFAAAICDFYGWSALSVIGHREWTRRKPDPGKCDMAAFRRAVRDQLIAGPNGDDMPLSPEDIAAIWSYKVGTAPGESVGTIMVRLDPGGAGIGSHVRDKVWNKDATSALDGSTVQALDLLRYAQGDSKTAAVILADPTALAAAIAAAMPPAAPIDQAALEAALREVLGSVDEQGTK